MRLAARKHTECSNTIENHSMSALITWFLFGLVVLLDLMIPVLMFIIIPVITGMTEHWLFSDL